jgi:hypothetical protein
MKARALAPLLFVATLVSTPARAAEPATGLVAVTSVTATSVLAGKNDRYAPFRVLDDDDGTVWCEGAADEGIGATLIVAFEEPTAVDTVVLEPGVRKSDKLFVANNRPTSLEVQADGGTTVAVTSKGKDRPVARLSGRPITRLSVRIAAVEKAAMNDSCITGLWFARGDDTLVPVMGASAAALKALPAATRDLSHALRVGDEASLAKLVQFPLTFRRGVEGPDAKPRKIVFKDARALARACKAGEGPGGAYADESLRKKPFNELLTRRLKLDEVVLDVHPGAEIGQRWHVGWKGKPARGWLLTDVDL